MSPWQRFSATRDPTVLNYVLLKRYIVSERSSLLTGRQARSMTFEPGVISPERDLSGEWDGWGCLARGNCMISCGLIRNAHGPPMSLRLAQGGVGTRQTNMITFGHQ